MWRSARERGWPRCWERLRRRPRQIERKIRLAGLEDVHGDGSILGAAGAVNVQGEQQQKLDVFANDLLTELLGSRRMWRRL